MQGAGLEGARRGVGRCNLGRKLQFSSVYIFYSYKTYNILYKTTYHACNARPGVGRCKTQSRGVQGPE